MKFDAFSQFLRYFAKKIIVIVQYLCKLQMDRKLGEIFQTKEFLSIWGERCGIQSLLIQGEESKRSLEKMKGNDIKISALPRPYEYIEGLRQAIPYRFSFHFKFV